MSKARHEIEINVTEKKGIRIITGSRSTYSTDFVSGDMIILCMNIFLTFFRSFSSIRLVFSKVLFILMFRVEGKIF